MALARQRADWARAAAMAAWAINCNGFTREPISPLKLIPPQFRPPPGPAPDLTEEERAHQSALGWRLLDRAFGGKTV